MFGLFSITWLITMIYPINPMRPQLYFYMIFYVIINCAQYYLLIIVKFVSHQSGLTWMTFSLLCIIIIYLSIVDAIIFLNR